jgi:sulfite reductase (NADPH) flavoprotein alpha-component
VGFTDGLQAAGYSFFNYAGDKDAKTVIVVLNSPFALAAQAVAKKTTGLGVVTVRVLRPWNEEALKAILPPSVQRIHVVDEAPTDAAHGPLFIDVFAALVDPSTSGPFVYAQRVVPTLAHDFVTNPSAFQAFLSGFVPQPDKLAAGFEIPNTKNVLFYSTPGSALAASSHLVQKTFVSHPSISARLLVDHDAFSRTGGMTAERLLLSPKSSSADLVPVPFVLPLSGQDSSSADFLAVLEPSLLKSHDLLRSVRPGCPVLVVGSWPAAELVSNLPVEALSLARERNLRICVLNTKALAEEFVGTAAPELDVVQSVLVHLTFLRLYLAKAATPSTVLKVAKGVYGADQGKLSLEELNLRAWESLIEVDLPGPSEEEANAKPTTLKEFQFSAVATPVDSDEAADGARLGSWMDAAKHLIFSPSFTPESLVPSSLSSYDQHPALRPELPDRTFLVTCTVNRRLTPLEYDRNVFHLEFDTSGTGLKYEIGEALGVHGWNDAGEVLDFCAWYGADPDRVITLPVPGTDGERLHTRTVFQALQQQIDLFGKPPKSFYTDLAEYATNAVDKYALLFIGSPEGASTFKRLSEKETVTFADVLSRWPSARPGVEKLCELVGDIKPRHYSIASAQAVVGDRVDLLVVTVDWVTPSGKKCYPRP